MLVSAKIDFFLRQHSHPNRFHEAKIYNQLITIEKKLKLSQNYFLRINTKPQRFHKQILTTFKGTSKLFNTKEIKNKNRIPIISAKQVSNSYQDKKLEN